MQTVSQTALDLNYPGPHLPLLVFVPKDELCWTKVCLFVVLPSSPFLISLVVFSAFVETIKIKYINLHLIPRVLSCSFGVLAGFSGKAVLVANLRIIRDWMLWLVVLGVVSVGIIHKFFFDLGLIVEALSQMFEPKRPKALTSTEKTKLKGKIFLVTGGNRTLGLVIDIV